MMHKCPKCGTEFEGKFCPECGNAWQEEKICPRCGAKLPASAKFCSECGEAWREDKTCPQCGAKLSGSTKFCSECGYSFTQQPSAPAAAPAVPVAPAPYAAAPVAPAPAAPVRTLTVEQAVKRVSLLTNLQMIFFAVFAALVPLFFLAPVIVITGGKLLGDAIPSESLGNVYQFDNYSGTDLHDTLIAMIALMACLLASLLVVGVMSCFPKLRYSGYFLAGKHYFWRKLAMCVGMILLVVLAGIAAVMIVMIPAEDYGLGVLTVGAAPILTVVFGFLGAGACCICMGVEEKLCSDPAVVAAREARIAEVKPSALGIWAGAHKKVIAIVLAAGLAVVAVSVAVPVALANRYNGTYFAYDGETEQYDGTRYFVLTGGSWEDETGKKGEIAFDGTKVTLSYDSSGGKDKLGLSDVTWEGELNGDVLTVQGKAYAKEGHQHTFDEWETIAEPDCTTAGVKVATCVCGHKNQEEEIPALGHHFVDHVCTRCGGSSNLELTYTRNDDGYSVTGIGSCKDTDIIIPEMYNDAFVTSIGEKAFYECSTLKSITIPASVTSIGNAAFNGCSSLKAVYITDLAAWCEIDFGNPFSNPLNYAKHLYVDGREEAELRIPDGVTEIKPYAFLASAFTSVVIPESVTSIGKGAFNICSSLKAVHITDLEAWCGIEFSSDSANPLYYAHSLLIDGQKATELNIPAGVTEIKQYAFVSGAFTSVVIPESVTSIGEWTFNDCNVLTNITIHEGVTSIGDCAFRRCSLLTRITFEGDSKLTSIGRSAFFNCSSLISIIIPESVTYIESGAFEGCSSLESVKFERTDGWKVSTNSDMMNARDVELGDSHTAAENLRAYSSYYWKRT